jgi:urate oxidase
MNRSQPFIHPCLKRAVSVSLLERFLVSLLHHYLSEYPRIQAITGKLEMLEKPMETDTPRQG